MARLRIYLLAKDAQRLMTTAPTPPSARGARASSRAAERGQEQPAERFASEERARSADRARRATTLRSGLIVGQPPFTQVDTQDCAKVARRDRGQGNEKEPPVDCMPTCHTRHRRVVLPRPVRELPDTLQELASQGLSSWR
jgi:hypothetical protein